MTIEELIDLEALTHIANYGSVKGMEPMAYHILNTSEHPLMRFRRNWIRATALRQNIQFTKEQQQISEDFAQQPVRKGATLRRQAVIHPYFMDEMRRRHKASWSDPDFIGSVKEANPAIFPKRTG